MNKKVLSLTAIFILVLSVICIYFFTDIFKSQYEKLFIGEYEVTGLAFTFDDYDYSKHYINVSELNDDRVPKEKFSLNKNEFYKLFNSRLSPPYLFAPYFFERYLHLDNITVAVKNIKELTEEEILNDKFLNTYNDKFDLSTVNIGYVLKITDNTDNYDQYFYLFDNEYYTYDELYAFKIEKYL